MIPLFQKTASLPSAHVPSTHYLLAGNGLFLVHDTVLFRATTRLAQRHPLLPSGPSLQLRIPRIPKAVMEQAYGFFLEVYRRHQGEAFAHILYDPKHSAFSLAVPPQRLTYYDVPGYGLRLSLGVHYEAIAKPTGFIIIGDIHSHGCHHAYFSCTDDHDDLTREGLHIVLGRLDQAQPDCCLSFVTNHTRFDLDQSATLEPFTVALPPPDVWLDRVMIEKVAATDQRHLPLPHQGANERP